MPGSVNTRDDGIWSQKIVPCRPIQPIISQQWSLTDHPKKSRAFWQVWPTPKWMIRYISVQKDRQALSESGKRTPLAVLRASWGNCNWRAVEFAALLMLFLFWRNVSCVRLEKYLPRSLWFLYGWLLEWIARGRVGRTKGRNTYNGHTQSRMLKTFMFFQIFGYWAALATPLFLHALLASAGPSAAL